MKKKIIYLILVLLSLFSFLSCKKEDSSTKEADTQKENSIESEESSFKETNIKKENAVVKKYTQKYIDFYDQKGNAFIKIDFNEKEFLDEEIWNNITLIDPQKTSDKNLGKIDGYYLIIACNDIDFSLGNHSKEEKGEYIYTELEKLSLKKGESFIKIQYDDPYDPMDNLYAKPNNLLYKEINVKLSNFRPSNNHIVYFWKDSTEIKENPAFISLKKEEKTFPKHKVNGIEIEESFIYALGKIDLDEDGKEDTILFDGDSSFGWLRELIDSSNHLKKSGVLKINNNTFPLASLSTYYLDEKPRVLDIDIVDINPNDQYKEIFLLYENIAPFTHRYLVFHYENNELHKIADMDLIPYFDLKYNINQKNASLNTKHLATIGGMEYTKVVSYKLDNNYLSMKELEESELNSEDKRITPIADKAINVYKKPDSDDILFVAQKGQHFIFLKTDNYSWVEVKEFESGQKGYLRFTENDKGFSFYQQQELGESFEDVFWPVPIPEPTY